MTGTVSSPSGTNPAGGGQEKCKAMVYWNPGSGLHPGSAFYGGISFQNTIYWNGCIEGGSFDAANPNSWARDGCILKANTEFCGGSTWGSADGSNTAMYGNTFSLLKIFSYPFKFWIMW